MPRRIAALLLCASVGIPCLSAQDPAGAPGGVDPEIRAVVDRFFATQAAEDADAYLALWSAQAPRPTMAQLRFIFDSGDDVFSDVAIGRVVEVGGRLRVRVFATRNRVDSKNMRADGTPFRYVTKLIEALTLVRDNGVLKIASEGSPADDLATAMLVAPDAAGRSALMDAEPDLVGEGLISAVSRGADSAARAGQFAAARGVYDIVIEIARRAGNRKAEGQALQNIANSAYFQRDWPGALEAYRRRLEVERAIPNEEGVAEALSGIGTVQYSRFEYTDALVTYREVVAIQERLGDENALGTTLISTGNVQFIQGDYEGAIADYSRGRDLLHKMFNLGSEARALEGLGRAYAARGDYGAALEAFAGVLAEARARGTEPLLGNATQNIGDVHFRLGNLEMARAAFDESRTHFETAKDAAASGRAWQALALTDLVATRFAAAEQEYGKSSAACAQVNDKDCMARATVGLAFAQSSQEHYDEAIVTYKKAIEAFTSLNKTGEVARAEVGLSHARLGRKDYDEARLAATRARDAAAGLHSADILWRAVAAQGRAWRRLNAPDKALDAAREAVAIVQAMTDASLRNPAERMAADGASAFALLALLEAESGDAPAALLTLELRRAHLLRAALATNEREISRGMTPGERDDERVRTGLVVAISAQLDQERQLPKPDRSRLEMLGERLQDAIAARARQQKQLFERLPALRMWRGLMSPPTADDLLAAVPPPTTVLHFAIDEDDLIAVAVTTGEAGPLVAASTRAVRRHVVAEKIGALTAGRLGDATEWRRVASDVMALIPEPALASLAGARRALIVPDDVLWRVPFEALPSGTGFIGDTVSISYAGSLQRASATPVAQERTVVLVAGAPDFAPDRLAKMKGAAPGWTPRSVEEGRAEIERIARELDGDVPREGTARASVLAGAEATEAALRARLATANVVQIAAPFRINAASPLFSRVYLSPGTGADASDDGALDVREMFNADASAQVAIFTDGGAGAMRDAAANWPTIEWAWRAAGVPRMIVARWPGDPAVSRDMLADFHARVQSGETIDAALRAAQEKVRARPETRAPFFWAGWMLIGG